MELGLVGLGRMGANMARRLVRSGHAVFVYDRRPDAVRASVEDDGARGAGGLAELAGALRAPRAVWLMIPSGKPVDDAIAELRPHLAPGDVIVDGGNSKWLDSQRRAAELADARIDFVDCGTSGGIWGLELGYCMMLGGPDAAIARLAPVLDALAPPDGWKHVGPSGAGHFAKMIHNGIEYGMLEAYAEGFEILAASEFPFDLAQLAALWNRGSVIRSWLLELAERAFARDPRLAAIRGYVEDSGEGRWTVEAALALDVPAEVLTLSLLNRFRSRQPDSFRDRVIAALRHEFGGHAVKETRPDAGGKTP